MVRERSSQRAIDVVLLAREGSDDRGRRADALWAALRRAGVQIRHGSLIGGTDPTAVRSQLAEAIEVSPGPDADGTAIAVLDADLVLNSPSLAAVLDDPRIGTGALCVAQDGHLVQLGVLKLAGADRAVAARGLRGSLEPSARGADLILELIRGLLRVRVAVAPVPLGAYAWARPRTAEQDAEALAAVSAIDERRVRLREAARGGDGFYSTFVLRKLSWRLTGLAERTAVTPNQVTLISFGLGLVAAALLAAGGRGWAVAGALLLQFCLVVDCVDGELARYRRRFSRFGAWLDATTDRVKEFATIGALAVAGARLHGHDPHRHDLYWLAAAAIAVQTFRNLLDLGWSIQRSASAAEPAAASDLWQPSQSWLRLPPARSAGPGARSWLRRIGHFPIGERFLLISLGAAFWTPRATLILLLAVGLLATGYLLGAFAVRSASSSASAVRLAGLADAGPLLGAVIGRLGGHRASRMAAALPAAVATAELGLIWWLAAGVAGAAPAPALVLVAVTAVAHYQHAYGVREDGEVGGLVAGGDLRLLALAAAAVLVGPVFAAGSPWASGTVWVLAALVALASTLRSLRAWTGPEPATSAGPASGPGRPDGAMMAGETMAGKTVAAETMTRPDPGTAPTVLRTAIGGVR